MPPKKRAKKEEDVVKKVWDHYHNFLESCGEDEEGDIDELQEIVQLLQEIPPTSTLGSTCRDLLPVLASMAHFQMASHAISQSVDTEHDENDSTDVLQHLQASLRFFPHNCSTWSLGADYARMQHVVSPAVVAQWYQKAATYASALRTQALELLEGDVEDDGVKEWLELLIVNGMLGTEYIDDEDEEEEVDLPEKEEEGEGYYSSSAVEGTSRFTSAMLLSTLGKHNEALEQLQHFDLTHRLHPHVWQQKVEESKEDGPTLFTGSVLPQELHDAMCRTFAPDAVYWNESDYAHRGYHSYFFDIAEPSNLIEEVIVNHLLPLAKKCYGGKEEIVGAEWWTHHRPIQANLGHNLHFDTDEALLSQEQVISHPIVSSVLYLTAGEGATSGPTIILDQTPDSKEVATKCWTCVPQNNSFMVFNGNQLHGVLPCPGDKYENEKSDNVDTMDWKKKQDTEDVPHRLTFMVGFWTRCVPDKMENRTVYGPCGPLPPADSTEWVRDINEYPKHLAPSKNLNESTLPKISPAWESIQRNEGDTLDIPRGVDHQFFVNGAPQCFRDSLFENDDEDEEC